LQFGVRCGVCEFVKGSFFDQLLCRANESAPRCAGERAANTHPPRAQFGCITHCQTARSANQNIDRLRRDGIDNCSDVIALGRTRRIQTIGAGFRIGDEAFDHLVNVLAADEKSFRAADEQNSGAMKRFTDRVDSFDCKINIIDWAFFSIGCVFDRKTFDSGLGAKPRILRAPVGIVSVAVFEIRVYWNVRGFDQLTNVREHVIAFDGAVR